MLWREESLIREWDFGFARILGPQHRIRAVLICKMHERLRIPQGKPGPCRNSIVANVNMCERERRSA